MTIQPALWLPHSAARYINRKLQPSWRGVEFGSGGSTLWWAKRVAHLTTIEHKESWHAGVQQALAAAKLTNVTAYLVRDLTRYADTIQLVDPPIDFVFVDGKERLACMRAGSRLLRPGGLLIMDNTDESIYAEATAFGYALPWPRREFSGQGRNPKTHQSQQLGRTTCWEKPEHETCAESCT